MGLERPFSVQTLVNLCMKRQHLAWESTGRYWCISTHRDFLKADPVNEPLDPEVFLRFFFSSVEFLAQKLGVELFLFCMSPLMEKMEIMTPKVLWVFFFLLKIICFLLHATGQISSFKTGYIKNKNIPLPNHLYCQPSLLSPIQEILLET